MKTYILVGMKHRNAEELVASLPSGEPLTLVRERTNAHDPFAVQVWAREQHVGYVRATQVRPLTIAMDAAFDVARRMGESDAPRFAATLSFSSNSRIPQVNVDESQGPR